MQKDFPAERSCTQESWEAGDVPSPTNLPRWCHLLPKPGDPGTFSALGDGFAKWGGDFPGWLAGSQRCAGHGIGGADS